MMFSESGHLLLQTSSIQTKQDSNFIMGGQYIFLPRFRSDLAKRTVCTVTDKSYEIAKHDLTFGESIGEGACGLVAKCKWHGKTCVAKMLRVGPCPNKLNHSCLLIEIAILAEIGTHPNLVTFYGACIEDVDAPIIVQEYIEGPNLGDYLKSKQFEFNLGTAKVCFHIHPAQKANHLSA